MSGYSSIYLLFKLYVGETIKEWKFVTELGNKSRLGLQTQRRKIFGNNVEWTGENI